MGIDHALTARESPVRVETVHESERTRVTRLFLPGRTVIRKQPLGPGWETRLRHELRIVERLRGVEGVAQLADVPPDPGSIMFDDVAGVCLTTLPMPFDQSELVSLALDIARVVAGMHRRGVMHSDIGPANILLCGPARSPCLIDFAFGSSFAEIRPEFTHHNEIVATLAYLAPELTGRTGRPVDQRADLYALGATLYELATGAAPFGSGDALRLIRDHLARVPVAPDQVNTAVPADLSKIIMHLLEKEPDGRYQTAEGLIHDLRRLRDSSSSRAVAPFSVGEHDFPLRLLAPSRLVGRETEIATLGAAFAAAASGQRKGVLVSGSPGVGKTSLIDELRPVVTGADGWFVAGKFDQYRRDQESDGVFQAFRGLGRLLLAEPEEELADLRQRMLRALGPNAGLVTAAVPEFAVLLNVAPEPGDPLTTQVRAQRSAVEILRAVVSRKRPMVFFVDDLQWAGRTPLGLVDMMLSEEGLDGLLVVGAYREDDVDATHPLTAMLPRWRKRQGGLEHIRLGNLPAACQAVMVADMLRLDAEKATGLARAIAPHTGGNPYDTVELLNALRHHGVLTPRAGRWWWDEPALSRYLANTDVAGLLSERADGMPRATRAILAAMACLGWRAELSLLQAATGQSATTVEQRLAPALDDGLLVMEPGVREAVRFRHDRIREMILRRLRPERQHALELGMARRLAVVPDLFAVAAQQYLPVIDAVRDADERRMVTRLLRRAAERATLLANYPLVEKLLAGALRLADPSQRSMVIELQTGRHAALYSVGRLDEADELYTTIDRLCVSPLERVDATLVQVSSLTSRNHHQQAVSLGVELLRQLGVAVPTAPDLPAEIGRGFDALHQWLDHSDETDDLRRPEITDPVLLATAALIHRILLSAYFADQTMATMAWLSLSALRLLAEHGPGPTLIGPAGYVVLASIAMRQDYRTGYRAGRRILTLGEARGYEPGTSQARWLFAIGCQWFEPLEDSVRQGQRAREGLILGGDLAYASYQVSTPQLLDCTPTLDSYVITVDAALAFARRTGNEQVHETLGFYRWLAGVMRGENGASATDNTASPERYPNNQNAVAHAHITRALVAAVFGDAAALAHHSAMMMPLLPAVMGTYPTAVAHLLRAMALTNQIRATQVGERATLLAERAALLAELDEVIDWLASRAADAPINFLHLRLLAEAERAWALGDLRAALHAFDAAQREVSTRQRPWHRALILERAAQFYLTEGMEHTGYALLAEARHGYHTWGAAAKVDDLDWAYPALHTPPHETTARDMDQPSDRPAHHRSTTTTGTINLLGIVSASQALSSQTSIDGLRTQVADVLSAMTGATDVHLLLYNDGRRDWWLSAPGADDGGAISLGEAVRRRLVPMSVFRYAERVREPLVVNDAIRDDRFARDPYFTDVERCSLLAVPILNRGVLQALLLLENRLIRNAFSTGRLDGVMLIAGQLAVSLDNAMVYASLERKVAERTDQLALANARLELLSITDPLTGLANRRRLEDALTAEWHRAERAGLSVALAMIDIDHFKLYNDHYGHTAGDHCLQRVANQLRQTVRSTDLIARYGGEEFAVVMPDTDIAAGLRSAERLRDAVAKPAEPHMAATEQNVTVSIGVAATVPTSGTNPNGLLEIADIELYRAKRGGRNQVRATSS